MDKLLCPELIDHIGSFLLYQDLTSLRATCHYCCILLESQRNKWIASIPVRFCHYSHRSSGSRLYIGWFPNGCLFDEKQKNNYRRYELRSQPHIIFTKQLLLQDIPLMALKSPVTLSTQGAEKYNAISFMRCVGLNFVTPVNKRVVYVPIRNNTNTNATQKTKIEIEFGSLNPCEDSLHTNLHNPLDTFKIPKRLTEGFDRHHLYEHYS